MPEEPEIPLLVDVVDPDEILFTEDAKPAVDPQAIDAQENFEQIRQDIATRLVAELQPVIATAIDSAVEQATGEIKKILLDELQDSLQNRVRLLLDQVLDKQFGQ